MKFREYQIGDRVKYTKKFLKSIFARATDDLWRAEGTVTELWPFDKVIFWPCVKWDGEDESNLIHPNNIGKSSSLTIHLD